MSNLKTNIFKSATILRTTGAPGDEDDFALKEFTDIKGKCAVFSEGLYDVNMNIAGFGDEQLIHRSCTEDGEDFEFTLVRQDSKKIPTKEIENEITELFNDGLIEGELDDAVIDAINRYAETVLPKTKYIPIFFFPKRERVVVGTTAVGEAIILADQYSRAKGLHTQPVQAIQSYMKGFLKPGRNSLGAIDNKAVVKVKSTDQTLTVAGEGAAERLLDWASREVVDNLEPVSYNLETTYLHFCLKSTGGVSGIKPTGLFDTANDYLLDHEEVIEYLSTMALSLVDFIDSIVDTHGE